MEKKRSFWHWLNPMTWLEGLFRVFATIFAPILRWLGMLTLPSTEGFENLTKSDVDDAKQLAEEQEAAVDAIVREMSPAEIVRAYARTDPAGRATMDLSALDLESQDWLLRLSDEDLAKLSMSTTTGCARSLERREVLPIYSKPKAEVETPEILSVPSAEDDEDWKREFVAARFRELFLATGVANPNPKFTPATVH